MVGIILKTTRGGVLFENAKFSLSRSWVTHEIGHF